MYTYAVLGAGRQGTAAAYDMVKWGQAESVILADFDLSRAEKSAEWITKLSGTSACHPAHLDVRDIRATTELIRGVDALLSAVPYYYNLEITEAALAARVNFCDLGGNTDIARKQHAYNGQACEAGISIIPNCGQVPGMGTTLMVYAMSLLDETAEVFMWDGGLPRYPRQPFNYQLTFNIAGLTNEYAEPAIFIRDGRIQEMEPMSEPEAVEFPAPIGLLEAFIAGGGTDTMPWTYEGKLKTLQNKTLRWPGHYAQLRAFYDLGIWSMQPVQVGGAVVSPRDVFHALFEPKVTFPGDEDMVIIRVKAMGKKNGRDAQAVVQVIDYLDHSTGFTAMERGTGWSAAIVAEMMAFHQTPCGAGGVETMVPPGQFVAALDKRGIQVTEQIDYLAKE
jgi:lysine 6-dehydrogenase